MSLGNSLRKLREDQRKSLKEVADRANLSVAQLSKLERGERGLDIDVFIEIARALGCQPGDLLPNSTGLYPESRQLLGRLNGIPSDQRDIVMSTINSLLDMREHAVAAVSTFATSTPDNVRPFPRPVEPHNELSDDAMERLSRILEEAGLEPRKAAIGPEREVRFYGEASAGEGVEFFDDIPEEYRQIPQWAYKRGARGIFKVKGWSMLDMGIADGQIIFVKPTPEPPNGSIVICTVNRKVYIKKLRRDGRGAAVQLIPKAPGYEPIELKPGDDVQFFGIAIGNTGDL